MSKYIPAVRVTDHFNKTIYRISFSTSASDSLQDALNKATREAEIVRNEDPIRRVDGLEYRCKSATPVVLKEVKIAEVEQ